MVRLYIADIDPIFVRGVRRAVCGCQRVEIVGEASSGRQALSDIRRLQPDVLLADIQLPELDGIGLLRETRRLLRPPSVIICTRFCSGASMEWACRYGAAYFLLKPVDFSSLPGLVLDCAATEPPPARTEDAGDERARRAAGVRALLGEFGISPKLNGCAYLVESVLKAREDGLLMRNLSRGLYQELARHMNSTVSRVERSLRSAIDVAYQRGTLQGRFTTRPSNKQFIEFLLKESERTE